MQTGRGRQQWSGVLLGEGGVEGKGVASTLHQRDAFTSVMKFFRDLFHLQMEEDIVREGRREGGGREGGRKEGREG